MGYLRMDGGFGSARSNRLRRRPARGLMGMGVVTSTSPDQWTNKCKPKRGVPAAAAIKEVYGAYGQVRGRLETLKSVFTDYERQAMALSREAANFYGISSAGVTDEISSALRAIDDAIREVDQIRSAYDAGLRPGISCDAHYKHVAGKMSTQWQNDILDVGRKIEGTVPSPARVESMVQNLAADVRREQEKIAQAEAEEADRILQEQLAIEQQRQAEIDAQEAAAAAAAARAEAERQAREYELEQQRLLFQQQQQLAEQEAAQRAAEREQIAAVEQAKIQAQLQQQQLAQEAENRRLRLQEEARLREEERQLRREEREAQLQQLMVLQELAAKGLPTGMLPAGLPAPMAPQGYAATAPGYGVPGQAVPPPFQQGGLIPGLPQYGPAPQQYPGMVPAAPAGYGGPMTPYGPAVPPAFQQGPAAPPGFAWASFDPGGEMFGMGATSGAMRPTYNTTVPGAVIRGDYTLEGPDSSGLYTLVRPDGSVAGQFPRDQLLMSPIKDGGQIVFVPPEEGAASSGTDIAKEIAATLRTGIEATGSVLAAREERKAAKYGPRTVYAPAPRRSNTALWVAGALAAGVGAVFLLSRKKKAG